MTGRTLLTLCFPALVLAFAGCGGNADSEAKPTGGVVSPTTGPSEDGSASSSAGDWPMLAHDISSSFRNDAETAISIESAGELMEAWTLDATVNGTAAVVEGVAYVQSVSGLYALDADSGTEIWHVPGIAGTSSVTYFDGVVYAHDSGAGLHAVDAATGEEVWTAVVDDNPFAQGFSSPVPAGDLIIVGSSSREEASAIDNATFRGGVVAFDRETGDEVWRYYTVEPPYNGASVWSTVSVDLELGLVYATTGNNYTGEASETSDSIFALELETGELVWNTQLREDDVFTIPNPQSEDTDLGTNPVLFDADVDGAPRRLLAAGQKSGDFWALDRETGEVVWNHKASGGSPLIGGVFNSGAFDGERLIIAGNNGASDAPGSEPASGESEPLGAASIPTSVLQALDPATGDVVWERQLPAWVWAPITIANGVGFVSAESELQAFDTSTGEKLFSLKTEGTITSGAAIAGGRVFFGSGLSYFNTTPGNTFRALALP